MVDEGWGKGTKEGEEGRGVFTSPFNFTFSSSCLG